MPGEGVQVEGGQRHRQKRAAVAEIVFEFAAVIFHYVEGLVRRSVAAAAGPAPQLPEPRFYRQIDTAVLTAAMRS